MAITNRHRNAVSALLTFAAIITSGCAVSRTREVEMGQDYSRQVDAQLSLVQDAEVNRYINVLGDSIARVADDRDLSWSFKIVNSPEVNAFAIPGGFIYINRGLIERTTNMSEVAGVLGHEIGHVTKRHSIQQMQKAQGANLGMIGLCVLVPATCNTQAGAGITQVTAGAVFAGFSRSAESEADVLGVEYLVRAGIDPRGIPAIFRLLVEERRRKPDAVDAWFATHPIEEDRIENTEKIIAQYDAAIIRGLTQDTERFRDFKARLKSLSWSRN
jgi:beta-barrel assembly-enhancing protease